jgi:hypothetical protein
MKCKYYNFSIGLMILLLLVGAMPAMAASAKIAVYSDYKSISDTSSSGLSTYADALRAQGYTVEQMYDPITSSKLDGCDALLIIGLDEYLSSSEKSAIEDFVENQDKGLLLSGGTPSVVNDLAQSFTGGSAGWFGSYIVCDPTDYEVYPKWVKIQTFYDHPITENLNRITMYKGTNVPAAWYYGGIIGCAYSDDDSWLDEDGDYVYDSGESRGTQPVLAYSSWDKIVIVPDGNVFDNSDADGDGIVAFNEYDNDVLGLNIAEWLAGGGSQEVQFKGTVTNILTFISATVYTIQIDEVISDPTGNLNEGDTAKVSLSFDSSAQVDSVEVGDTVEVHGTYAGSEGGEHTIALEGSGSSLVKAGQFSEPIKIGESFHSCMAVYSNSIYIVWGEYVEGGEGEYPLLFRKSDDGGITWSTPVSIDPQGGPFATIAADSNGVYVTYHGHPYDDYGIYFTKSTDGGDSWTTPKKIGQNSDGYVISAQELPFVKVDSGNIYVYYNVYEGHQDIIPDTCFKKSEDGGLTWTTTILDKGAFGGIEIVNNVIYMLFQDKTSGDVWFRKSINGGVTWSSPVMIDSRCMMHDDLVIHSNEIFVSYMKYDYDGETYHTWLRKSSDDGVTWSTPLKIRDLEAWDWCEDIDVFSGKIYFIYENKNDLWFSESVDDGNTWENTIKIDSNFTGGVIKADSNGIYINYIKHTEKPTVTNTIWFTRASIDNGDDTKPDLTITNLSWSPEFPTSLDVVTYTVEIKNIGTATAENFILKVDIGGEPMLYKYLIDTLLPGATYTQNTKIRKNCGDCNIIAVVDADGTVDEIDETNNATVKPISIDCGESVERALIIGISDYQYYNDLGSQSINSAKGIYNLLRWGYGYDRENVILLLDDEATKENIKREIWGLVGIGRKTDKNDKFVFYYTGHGAHRPDKEEGIVPYDVPVNDGKLDPGGCIFDLDKNFDEDYLSRNVFDGDLIAIFDTCLSGGFCKETDINDGVPSGVDGDRRVVLMSTKAGETLRPYDRHYLKFTRYLLDAFASHSNEADLNADRQVSVEEAFEYAKNEGLVLGWLQHPQIMDHYPDKSNREAELHISDELIVDKLIEGEGGSSVHIHAYDSEGRHVGITDSDNIVSEIPGAWYSGSESHPEEIIIFGISEDITFTIEGQVDETFNFTIRQFTDANEIIVNYDDVSIKETGIATVDVSQKNPTYTMEIDDDGDGTPEHTT